MLKGQGEKDNDLSCQNSPLRRINTHPSGNIQQLTGTCHHGVAKPGDDRWLQGGICQWVSMGCTPSPAPYSRIAALRKLTGGPLGVEPPTGCHARGDAVHIDLWSCAFPLGTSGGAVEGSMTGHRKLDSLEIAMLTPPGTFLLEHKDKTPSLPSLAISECPVAERDACPSSARTACL